jgi:hypothetical protein
MFYTGPPGDYVVEALFLLTFPFSTMDGWGSSLMNGTARMFRQARVCSEMERLPAGTTII